MVKQLPLWQALAWIIASIFFITGPTYLVLKWHLHGKREARTDPQFFIRSLIQTGPEKQALPTECLAELLGLSMDHLQYSHAFDVSFALQRLQQCPLFASCVVRVVEPDAVFVDYTLRQPIAWIEDFDNLVVDKEGYPLPCAPFFAPKPLPSLYLGVHSSQERPEVRWNEALSGKHFDLGRQLLQLVATPEIQKIVQVRRIDVSNAFAESYGTREIVLLTEDHILRLSTKNYAQELGNYLKLRPQLLEAGSKEKTVDLRIDQLAFIEGL